MADKSFGVDQLNILGTGTPTITSPNQLNLECNTVAISTSCTIGNNITITGNVIANGNIVGDNSTNISGIASVTATTYYGSGANLTGISAGISTDPSNVQATWKLGGGSGSGFTFTGPGQDGSEGNPDIYLVRGQRYLFDNTALAGNHPFEFRNAANDADYTDGVSGAQNGLQYINVQHDAPPALKYRCTIHTNSMLGNIFIGSAEGGVGVGASIHSPASNILTFGTSNTERLRIASDGLVGIGTVSPTGSLHIHSTSPQLTLSDSDTGAHGQINCSSSEGNLFVEVDKNSGITTTQTYPRFGVRVRGTEKFAITHNGEWRLDNGYGAMQSGSAGQVLTSGGPNSWARWTDQTDVLDMWKCTADITNSDQTVRYFDLNDWTQLTSNPYANLGYIGAYESQGRFRMPSTGYYEITAIIGWSIYNSTAKSCVNAIYTTTDNSTYTEAVRNVVHTGGGQAGTNQSSNTVKLYWKVNNISNDKFRISYSSFNSDPYIESDTTFLYIKKLRDL